MAASKVKAFRLPDALATALDAVAERRGVKVNFLVVELLEAGLRSAGATLPEPQPKAPNKADAARAALTEAEGKAAHLAQGDAGRRPGRAAPGYWKGALANVQEGPSPVFPGSRLKGAKRSKIKRP